MERNPSERMLIFINQKKQADLLVSVITLVGKKPATSIHGNQLQREREQALGDFKRGDRPILVAKAVAARSLDIPNIEHVVNYDMPTDVDEYVHRVGHTGRVGNIGFATSFFDPQQDSGIMVPLCSILKQSGVELPPFLTQGGYGDYGAAGADEEW